MDLTFDALVLARAVHFGAMFLLFGGALFFAYAPRDAGAEARAFPRAIAIAAPLALVSGAGWLVETIIAMTGPEGLRDPATLHAVFFETTFGPIEAARMALLAVLVAVAFVPMPARMRLVLVAILSGLLLVSQAWLGHAAEDGGTWRGAAMVAAYAVHVLAGAAWLGGLPLLLARLVALRRRAAARRDMLALLSRFSAMASLAVVLVLASGLANAAFRTAGHLGTLMATPYGEILLTKVALVALMLGFAAYTRLVAMPRLRAPERYKPAIARTMASLACEIVVGGLVLMAAAVLGITPPPG